MGCYPSRLPKENATHIVPDALPDYSDPPSHNEHNKYHDADIEDILDDLEETKDLINWLIEHHVWAGSSPAVDYLNFYTAVLNRFKTYKSLQRQGMETDELKKEMRLNATEIIRNFNSMLYYFVLCDQAIHDSYFQSEQIWKSSLPSSTGDCKTFPAHWRVSKSLMSSLHVH